MSKLTEFYALEAPDCEGRMLDEYWRSSNEVLEYSHDRIQWLFPLVEPSNYNPNAPLLTPEDIAIFKADPKIRENVITSLCRILRFFGLSISQLSDDLHLVGKSTEWDSQSGILFAGIFNHNHLRMTRILTCLNLLGFRKEAEAVFEFLKKYRSTYSDNCWWYWEEAMKA